MNYSNNNRPTNPVSLTNLKEGFDPNTLLTYDSNSPKNSHNVDIINTAYIVI